MTQEDPFESLVKKLFTEKMEKYTYESYTEEELNEMELARSEKEIECCYLKGKNKGKDDKIVKKKEAVSKKKIVK